MTHRDTQLAQLDKTNRLAQSPCLFTCLPPTPIQVWAKVQALTIPEPKTPLVRS